MPYVLDGIAHSGVAFKGWSWKLSWELTFQDIFREERVRNFGSWRRWVAFQLSLCDPFLDQLVKNSEIKRSIDFRLASDCIDGLLFWRAAIYAWSWLLSCLIVYCSRMTFSRSRAICSRSRSDWAYYSFICSFILASIWRSWSSCRRSDWTLAVTSWGEKESVSSVVCGWSLVEGPCPQRCDDLAFGHCVVDGLLSWGHHRWKRVFVRKVFWYLGERSWV